MVIFAYFGPETALPLSSAAAAVVGLILMFGRVAMRHSARAARQAGRIVGLGRSAPRSRPGRGG